MAADSLRTILIVEDEESILDLLRLILDSNGYHVLAAPTGEEGLRIVKAFPGTIHLLIADITLPDLSGRELAERIQKLRPELRILFISGYEQQGLDEFAAVSKSNANFLSKPFGSAILLKRVADIIAAP